MARRIKNPLRVIERHPLDDGSVLELMARPDRHGRASFMHVTPTRAQAFRTGIADWLAHYGRSFAMETDT